PGDRPRSAEDVRRRCAELLAGQDAVALIARMFTSRGLKAPQVAGLEALRIVHTAPAKAGSSRSTAASSAAPGSLFSRVRDVQRGKPTVDLGATELMPARTVVAETQRLPPRRTAARWPWALAALIVGSAAAAAWYALR